MAQAQQTTRGKQTTIKRNGLIVECVFGGNSKLERKIECYDRQFTEYAYLYDAKGHLAKVRRDGMVVEHYQYNRRGQRIEQQREYRGFSDCAGGMLHYDEAGRLVRAGDTSFYYDNRDALSERCDSQGITKYFYGKDTILDKVILPSRAEIRYEYDKSNPAVPTRRFRNGTLTAEFAWDKSLLLTTYRSHDSLLEYTFAHDASGILNKVRIDTFRPQKQKNAAGTDWAAASSDWLGSMVAQNRCKRLHDFFGKRSMPFELFCGCDQVGTVKILTDRSGRIVKEIVRDSFGVQCSDSFPDLFMPIGFAGGLTDPDTGLVRFGYRDYDPSVGRFTALDPAKDRRGDGDLYDYCVDDPVNRLDSSGLMFSPLSTTRERPETKDILRQPQTLQGRGDALRSGRLYAAAANAAIDAANPPQAAQPAAQAPALPAPAQGAAAQQPAQAAQAQAAQPQANAADATLPAGVRRNNPGNLRPLAGDQWQGQVRTEDNFSVFDTPENGLRALGINTISRQVLYGQNTVGQIIGAHAPAGEQNPHQAAYIRHVARHLGVEPDAQIDTRDPATLRGLMEGIIGFENGQQHLNRYTENQLNDAANAAITHHNNRRRQ